MKRKMFYVKCEDSVKLATRHKNKLLVSSEMPKNIEDYTLVDKWEERIDSGITILRDVVWQVSPKGKLTPVAIFDPVLLGRFEGRIYEKNK